jgi:hypothetical protein
MATKHNQFLVLDFQDIMTHLENNVLSPEQTNMLILYIKSSRKRQNAKSIRQFGIGDLVEFTGKDGQLVVAKVTKLGSKCVYCTSMRRAPWRVSAVLCRPYAGPKGSIDRKWG